MSHSLPQVPGCPFSGVKSPSLCLHSKALQRRCSSPQVGCKGLKQHLFQSHGPHQQHSILHIKVLTHHVWTHSQAPWFYHPSLPWRNIYFLPSGSSSSSLPQDWKNGEDFIQPSHAWLNFARKDLFLFIPHFRHTKYERPNRPGCIVCLLDEMANAVKVLTCVIFCYRLQCLSLFKLDWLAHFVVSLCLLYLLFIGWLI